MVELKIVIEVFKACPFSFNLISDSSYVVNALRILESAGTIKSSSPVCSLFAELQQLIWLRKNNFYPSHIRAHSGLPGPVSKGNDIVDHCTQQEWIFSNSAIHKATEFHKTFHVNSRTLQQRFSLSGRCSTGGLKMPSMCDLSTPTLPGD